jgi:spore coat protein U-like protein
MTARLLGLGAVLAMAAGAAWADTANIDVTANIKGVCRIESIQSVDFGDLEQGTTAADKQAAGAVNYWCTKGVPYTITLGIGLNPAGVVRQMKGTASTNSAELLKYDLIAQSPTTGLIGRGPATPEALALQGTVLGADYNILSVGGFKDTVIITVTP